nr:hypothetical protein [Tanacetum cinerariifolium]
MTQLKFVVEMFCQFVQKKREEKRIEEEHAAKAQNWKLLVCYDDDDEEECSNSLQDNIISELPPCVAVTPTEPLDSLVMKDEHLDTIPATKSDEFIKSGVENFIPIPSVSEGIPEHMCDVPSHDNSLPLDVSKDTIEDLFESNEEFSSTDDDSFSFDKIDYVEASPPDSELASSEVMEIVIPKVGGIKASNDNPIRFYDPIISGTPPNLTPSGESDFFLEVDAFLAVEDEPTSSQFPKSYLDQEGDMLLFEAFLNNDHSSDFQTKSSSTSLNSLLEETNNFDNSFPAEYDCFLFTDEPNSKDFTKDVVENISPTKEPQVLTVLPTHPTLQLNMKFQPSSESLFAYVVWIFLPFLMYSVVPCYLLSLWTEDIIFDPGICKIDETDCHLEEEIRLTKRFLYDNLSPRPPEEIVSDNSNADIKSFSPSHIPIKDSDSHMEEINLSLNPVEPNSRDFTKDVVENISPTKEPQVLNTLPTHPTLQLNMKFQPSSESLFAYVVWIFFLFLVYSVVPCYLLSLRNEDIIFDPGICKSTFSKPDISHRCGNFTTFNTHLTPTEPLDSLIMEDEHLDTILAMKSDEFIKSGVENLISIPSESEGIPEHICDVPSHDNSPPLGVLKDTIEDLFESNEEFSSTDDGSFSFDKIDYVEASPPDSELISLEVMEIVIPEVGGIKPSNDNPIPFYDPIISRTPSNLTPSVESDFFLEGDMLHFEAFLNNDHSSDFQTKSSSTSLNSLLEETNNFDNYLPAGFTTFSNVLFDVDYDSDSSEDQSLSDEAVREKIYLNPLFDEEIIPMEIDP